MAFCFRLTVAVYHLRAMIRWNRVFNLTVLVRSVPRDYIMWCNLRQDMCKLIAFSLSPSSSLPLLFPFPSARPRTGQVGCVTRPTGCSAPWIVCLTRRLGEREPEPTRRRKVTPRRLPQSGARLRKRTSLGRDWITLLYQLEFQPLISLRFRDISNLSVSDCPKQDNL